MMTDFSVSQQRRQECMEAKVAVLRELVRISPANRRLMLGQYEARCGVIARRELENMLRGVISGQVPIEHYR